MLDVDKKWVHPLPMDVATEIPGTGGVRVTPIEANHCPGSALFLFEGRQTAHAGDSAFKSPHVGSNRTFRYLHCGDFRASPQHVLHPAVKEKKIDTVYLDTTYLDPKVQRTPCAFFWVLLMAAAVLLPAPAARYFGMRGARKEARRRGEYEWPWEQCCGLVLCFREARGRPKAAETQSRRPRRDVFHRQGTDCQGFVPFFPSMPRILIPDLLSQLSPTHLTPLSTATPGKLLFCGANLTLSCILFSAPIRSSLAFTLSLSASSPLTVSKATLTDGKVTTPTLSPSVPRDGRTPLPQGATRYRHYPRLLRKLRRRRTLRRTCARCGTQRGRCNYTAYPIRSTRALRS
jgi:hypothetical protein